MSLGLSSFLSPDYRGLLAPALAGPLHLSQFCLPARQEAFTSPRGQEVGWLGGRGVGPGRGWAVEAAAL